MAAGKQEGERNWRLIKEDRNNKRNKTDYCTTCFSWVCRWTVLYVRERVIHKNMELVTEREE